jgi:periplasmic protein TonB
MAEVSPWLDVFTATEIARAADVDVRDVRALLTRGRVPTIEGEFVAAGHAVEVVRSIRSGTGVAIAPRELFNPPAERPQDAGVPLAGSVIAHALMLGAFALLFGITPVAPKPATRFDPSSLVYLATPGPGGGGGGGGLKQPAAPPRAELQGASRMRSPVVTKRVVEGPKSEPRPEPPPDPTPVEKPVEPPPPEQKPDPAPPVVAPVASVPADTRDRAGLPEEKPSSVESRGKGTDGGVGSGAGTGIGEGTGSGIGPGSGGGTGGGPFRPGSGITPPSLLREVKPDYTEEARRRGINGDVELEIVVRSDGTVGDVRLKRGLGYGLDQRAIDAVRQWRFSPARRQGSPVDVLVEVAVEFKLR